MLELLLTSFPVVIQYWRLKRRGEHITVWNMHVAIYTWMILAAVLFTTVFYFHPKSYTGLVAFRLAPVVPQVGGPVTNVYVENGMHVTVGDLLFTIEDSRQKADVATAIAKLAEVKASFAVTDKQLNIVAGKVASAKASYKQIADELGTKQKARKKNPNTDSRREIERLQNTLATRQGTLNSARAEFDAMKVNLAQMLPAQMESAKAALMKAQNELSKTQVKAFTVGTITQIALTEGASASRIVRSPSLLIIPDQKDGVPFRMVAGFAQTANAVLKAGMPVEVACETNTNMLMSNVVLPARIAFKQDAIAAGQFVASGALIEPRDRAKRGSVLVTIELAHKQHEPLLLNGSGCIVQAYTNDLPGFTGHVISALGIVKAVLFRIKVWVSMAVGIGLIGGG
ncbi:MAG: biotin/lipoyl-binding protein, partial [Sneathiella sp.]